MSHTIEIQFFNTFILRSETTNTIHVEESRIKGGYNEPFVSIGPKAHLVDENYSGTRRDNALIYSGVYNSRTDINRTNVFSSGEPITRAVNPADGSIQKLHAEETNLNILQENKVSYALIDKDALFTAEGGQLTASGAAVIGQIVPYQGEYGTQNPESFAVKGIRKYFVDKNRAAVLRLSRDGITEISNYGMRDWFRDNLENIDISFSSNDKIVGIYDDHDDNYVISLQYGQLYKTLSFDDSVNGWVSFYTYNPDFGFSYNKKYYTLKENNVWLHYDQENLRNKFYDSTQPSTIQFIANQEPSMAKNFLSINYEGTNRWNMQNAFTDMASANSINESTFTSSGDITNTFKRKENKYYSHLDFSLPITANEGTRAKVDGLEVSGIKGYYNVVTMEHKWQTPGELYAVSHNITKSS